MEIEEVLDSLLLTSRQCLAVGIGHFKLMLLKFLGPMNNNISADV